MFPSVSYRKNKGCPGDISHCFAGGQSLSAYYIRCAIIYAFFLAVGGQTSRSTTFFPCCRASVQLYFTENVIVVNTKKWHTSLQLSRMFHFYSWRPLKSITKQAHRHRNMELIYCMHYNDIRNDNRNNNHNNSRHNNCNNMPFYDRKWPSNRTIADLRASIFAKNLFLSGNVTIDRTIIINNESHVCITD